MSGVLGTEAYKNYFGNPVSYRQGGITASMPAGSLVGEWEPRTLASRRLEVFEIGMLMILCLRLAC